jgi:TonB-linked SusC/RagA family outer membrane protein
MEKNQLCKSDALLKRARILLSGMILCLVFLLFFGPGLYASAALERQYDDVNNTVLQAAKIISGTVKDEEGNTVPGATVFVKNNPRIGTITDADGRFELSLDAAEGVVIVISFIGKVSEEITLGPDTRYSVVLKDDVLQLQTVTVVSTGYQDIPREMMTGSYGVVTAKDLENTSFMAIDRALEGKIAGLYSSTPSGAPGVRSQLRIRGDNSLIGNKEPLWVIDGLPMSQGVYTINAAGGVGNIQETILDHGIGNLNANDIESITVLKDAASTAIYGARAANGVIVIRTKRGVEGPTIISYTGGISVGEAPGVRLDFMNSVQKADYEISLMEDFQRYDRAGRVGRLWDEWKRGVWTDSEYNNQLAALKGTDTDWFDVIFRKSFSHNHHVSLRGGTNKTTYYASLNAKSEKGVLQSNDLSQLGVSTEIAHKLHEKVMVAFKLDATYREANNHNSAIDPFKYAVFANPYEKPYTDDGDYAADLSYLPNNIATTYYGFKYPYFNILREINETGNKSVTGDATARLSLNWQIHKDLKFDLIGSASYGTNDGEVYADRGTYASYINNFVYSNFFSNNEIPESYNAGYLRESSGRNKTFALRATFNYNKEINEIHRITAFLGGELWSSESWNNMHKAPQYDAQFRFIGFPAFAFNPDLTTIISNRIANLFGTGYYKQRTSSVYAALTYSLFNKYVLNSNIRFDGMSTINPDNRWTPFWSVGARWNIHKENFIKEHLPFISELSLRGIYGYTGDTDTNAAPYTVMYLSNQIYDEDYTAGVVARPNPNIKWSKKEERSIGLDYSLFDNTFGGSIVYYYNTVTDLLSSITTPDSYGTSSITMNSGSVYNKGWEMVFNLRLTFGNFRWISSVNFEHNKNYITNTYYKNLMELKDNGVTNQWRGFFGNVNDYPQNTVFGYEHAGVNPITGSNMIYLSDQSRQMIAEGMGRTPDSATGQYDISDIPDKWDVESNTPGSSNYQNVFLASMKKLGSLTPDFTGGFTSSLIWKNLELRLGFSFATGHIIESYNERLYAPGGDGTEITIGRTNRLVTAADRWRRPGDVTSVGMYSADGLRYTAMITDDRYEKGDYLAFRDIALNYNVDAKFVKLLGMQNMRVGLQVQNVHNFTEYRGLDVTTRGAFNYPLPRMYVLNLQFSF